MCCSVCASCSEKCPYCFKNSDLKNVPKRSEKNCKHISGLCMNQTYKMWIMFQVWIWGQLRKKKKKKIKSVLDNWYIFILTYLNSTNNNKCHSCRWKSIKLQKFKYIKNIKFSTYPCHFQSNWKIVIIFLINLPHGDYQREIKVSASCMAKKSAS